MSKTNCQFNGSGGQYFATVLIHLIILGSITCGIYQAWAWVRIFKLKASHTLINGKSVTFNGSGGQLLIIALVQGLLTIITLGFYGPWAMCAYFKWKAQNTIVGDKPSQFTGTGGSLFVLYLIHLMILPLLTLGIYSFVGMYRLFAWKEEHSKYGGERTTFGAGFGGFLKLTLLSYILNAVTLQLFMPWALCMLYKWQISGLAVGDNEEIEHFPPVKVSPIIVVVMIILGLIPFLLIAKTVIEQASQGSQLLTGPTTPIMKPLQKSPPTVITPKAPNKATTPAKAIPAPKKKMASQNLDLEIKKLNDLLKTNQKNAGIYYNRGVLYASKNDTEQAIIDYSKAIEIDKNHADAHYNRGLAYIKKERYEEAIRDFTATLKTEPNLVDALCNRGNVFYILNNYSSAIRDYTTAINIKPKDPDLYLNRSIVYRAKGDEQNAKKDAGKATKLRGLKPKESTTSPKKQENTAVAIWKEELSNVSIPEIAAEGRIHGDKFVVESAKLKNGILTIRDGKDFFPDHVLIVFLFLKKGDNIEGKTFDIKKTGGFSAPHVHMQWREPGKSIPETEMFTKDYNMRLHFGAMDNGKIPVKIYLCLSDAKKSFVAGTLTAEVK